LVKLIQKIPGLKNWNADPDTIQKRFGIFGESIFIGLFLGVVIGILAGYSVGDVIEIGVAMAAVMVLMPRMVKLLMEGLMPVSESARDWLNKKFGETDIYIGLDAAVALGHPAVISTALIFVPITVVLAIILPGNAFLPFGVLAYLSFIFAFIFVGLDAAVALGHPAVISTALILVPITVVLAIILPGNALLPFGDLATIPFIVAFIVGAARGNIVHSVIVGTVMIAISLYIATDVAPIFTDMATNASFEMPEGSTQISSIDQGGNIVNWVIYKLFSLFN